MDEQTVLNEFLRRYLEDVWKGQIRSLEDYQLEFPGHEALIAREHQRLLDKATVSLRGDTTPTPPAAGRPQVAHYKIVRELGRGGQGVVYLAEDTRLHRRVALKVLSGVAALSASVRSRFLREAETASRLDHPNICAVYDVGEADGAPYIAMRYVTGQALNTKIALAKGVLDSDGALPGARHGKRGESDSSTSSVPSTRAEIVEVLSLMEKAARAVHAAHAAGLIHRDIKPANIMVSEVGEPIILDFGLARDMEQDLVSLTQTGQLMGTPAYMSPEQVSGQNKLVDHRTDVYSLGATLFECLTLRRPFEAAARDQLYLKIISAEVPDPRALNAHVTKDLRTVTMAALAKDRERRYQTAFDLAEDLRRVREGAPIVARPLRLRETVHRWIGRRPKRALATGALALVVLAALALFVYPLLVPSTCTIGLAISVGGSPFEGAAEIVIDGETFAIDTRRTKSLQLASRESYQVKVSVTRSPAVDPVEVAYSPDRDGDSLTVNLVPSTRTIGLAFSVKDTGFSGVAELEIDGKPFRFTLDPARPTRLTVPWRDSYRVWASGVSPPLLIIPTRFTYEPARDGPTMKVSFKWTWYGHGSVRKVNGLEAPLVMIEPGRFQMGGDANKWEQPIHAVRIRYPFWIGKHEVTQREFRMFVEAMRYEATDGRWKTAPPLGDAIPVRFMAWKDAAAFCTWLTTRERKAGRLTEGYVYRLPTEAEWEYCCRAGRRGAASDGKPLGDRAWFLENSGKQPHPVGSRAANGWGIHDMLGNVWEYCLDRCQSVRYGPGKQGRPATPTTYRTDPVVDPYCSAGAAWIMRGGGFDSARAYLRVSDRFLTKNAAAGTPNTGFRVVYGPPFPRE